MKIRCGLLLGFADGCQEETEAVCFLSSLAAVSHRWSGLADVKNLGSQSCTSHGWSVFFRFTFKYGVACCQAEEAVFKKITAIITIIYLAWRQREHAGHEIISVYLPYDGWRSVEPNVSECQDLCLLFFLLATLQVEFAIHSEWSQLFYKAIKSFKLEATGVKSLLGVAREGGVIQRWARGRFVVSEAKNRGSFTIWME